MHLVGNFGSLKKMSWLLRILDLFGRKLLKVTRPVFTYILRTKIDWIWYRCSMVCTEWPVGWAQFVKSVILKIKLFEIKALKKWQKNQNALQIQKQNSKRCKRDKKLKNDGKKI